MGEHLLAWVQDLESFAASEAFADLQVLRGEAASLLSLSRGWILLKEALEIVDVRESLAMRANDAVGS